MLLKSTEHWMHISNSIQNAIWYNKTFENIHNFNIDTPIENSDSVIWAREEKKPQHTEFASICDVAVFSLLAQPHVFDKLIVAFGEAGFTLATSRCGHFIVSLYNIAAFQKVSSQRRCI